MPEMLDYFGRSFRVAARVERACDTISPISGARRIPDTVILEMSGAEAGGHGGCQAGCRIYWKEAWLCRSELRVNDARDADDALERLRDLASMNSRSREAEVDGREFYRCQATEFVRASTPLGWWDARSFLREVTSQRVSLDVRPGRHASGFRRNGAAAGSQGLAPLQAAVGAPGRQQASRRQTPTGHDRSRWGSAGEIERTLDSNGKLRGLWFDREMLPYCGASATIKAQVTRFIDEKTGEMVELESDCYILDGVVCRGHISEGRWFCCRAIYPWWREAWLERDEDFRGGK